MSLIEARTALYQAKTCLEQQLVEWQERSPDNEFYLNVERICAALDTIAFALGEKKPDE